MTQNLLNKIDYSNYYVAFLDILGFKKLVLSKQTTDKQKIEEYFHLIEDTTNELKQIKAKRELGSIIISDSVILSVPVGDSLEIKIENLRHLCVAVGNIQYALALKNIWLRGAISSGEAYFNPSENQIVGPAYIKAFLLEEREALHPRVILDNKIIGELEADSAQDLIEKINNKQNGGLSFKNWSKEILFEWQHNGFMKKKLKQDVALFIDYLHPLFFDSHDDFEKIISNIKKSLYSENEVYPKFRWVVDYLLSNAEFYTNYPNRAIEQDKLHSHFLKLQKA